MKLIKRTKIPKLNQVYNLHIQNNHNYIANNIVVSNCHGAKGRCLQDILIKHAGKIAHRIGVTGTLPKEPVDLMNVHIALGPVRYTIYAHELMERKVLASLQINIMQLDEDLTEQYETWLVEECPGKAPPYKMFKDGYFGDYSAEKSYLYYKQSRIEYIATFLNDLRDSGNILCLVGSIAAGKKIAAHIPNAITVNGQDTADPDKRKKIYDLFATNNGLVVIATPNIAGTGLSINRIYNVVTVDLGKSFIKTIQGIGRGLRTSEDKTHLNMYDICSDLKYSKLHLKERIQFYDEAKYKHNTKKIKYETRNEI